MKKVLIVDFNCILYTAIFVWRNNKNQALAYYILMFLFKYIKLLKPEEVYLVADGGGSWRKEIYPQYKCSRKGKRDKETDIPWEDCFRWYDEILDNIQEYSPITTIKVDSLEGDDIISYLCRYVEGDITILSKDKDLQQLLCIPTVSMYDMYHKKLLTQAVGNILEEKVRGGDESDDIPPATNFKEIIRNSLLIDLMNLPKVIDNTIRFYLDSIQKDPAKYKFFTKVFQYKFLPKGYSVIYKEEK